MNKMMIEKLLAILMAFAMMCGVASAETAENGGVDYTNMPERGLIFTITESDVNELHMATSFYVGGTEEVNQLPVATINYTDEEGFEKTLASFTEEQLEDPEMFYEILEAVFAHNHTLCTIALFEKDFFDAQTAAGKTAADLLGAESTEMVGENDGYVYVAIDNYDGVLATLETDSQKTVAEKAIARCKEIVATLSFQPVVFAEGEFTDIPEGAITFSTQDLNGNVVTNELFLGKKLTVFNIWGTFCTPCINEMPELAEWSQNMPEGVQLVGLVSDLNSYDDAEILEMAQMICEATGADVYTSLVANEDFTEMLSGVVGVPTTFFIDGNGVVVGSPVVGANVAACKDFVESYLAE